MVLARKLLFIPLLLRASSLHESDASLNFSIADPPLMGAVLACDLCFGRGRAVDKLLCNNIGKEDNMDSPAGKDLDANRLQLLPKTTRVAIVLGRSSFFSLGWTLGRDPCADTANR